MTKTNHIAALALGGIGRIGMNMMVYECNGQYIVVDAGVSFGDDSTPGVDIIIPDTKFLREHGKNIKAVFITHAHEDHIGGIGYLWDDFGGAPVYATPFARLSMEGKLREMGIKPQKGQVNTAHVGEVIEVGPFKVEYVAVSHSIPEACGLAIGTPYGTVVHTADYKFDDQALLNWPTNEKRWAEIGKQGVLAAFGDSTGIFASKENVSEAEVLKHLDMLIGQAKHKVFFASFASHVGRALAVAELAAKHGRKTCFLGRTINKMTGWAKELNFYPNSLKGWVIDAEEAAKLPANKVLVFASGTQGETEASLSRLANGTEVRGIRVTEGDSVILSSRMIAGNEKAIMTVINGLYSLGATMFTQINDKKTHVSGHASRPEIQRMYGLLKPRYVVPVHGETSHLMEHAKWAKEWGYTPLAIKPGYKLVLAGEGVEKAFTQTHVHPHGYNYVDGLFILGNDPLPIKERRKLSFDGVVSAAIAIRKSNGEWLGDVNISTRGLIDEQKQKAMITKASALCAKALETVFPDGLVDNTAQAGEVLSATLRKLFKQERGKSPSVLVQVVEI
ncbi:MAG: ribonuclease J [Alphaproteobacteria bacterium]